MDGLKQQELSTIKSNLVQNALEWGRINWNRGCEEWGPFPILLLCYGALFSLSVQSALLLEKCIPSFTLEALNEDSAPTRSKFR
jgi:hypothetical protein